MIIVSIIRYFLILEDCTILQSIWDTTVACLWQFTLQALYEHKYTELCRAFVSGR